jgi:OFA family oxalate/formate antiporter-like MFS transporter
MADAFARRWLIFGAMSLLFFVASGGAFASLGVVLPAMVKDLRWSWAEAGFGYTLLGIACGVASLMPAFMIRRFGLRGALGLGAAIMVFGFLLMAFTETVHLYLLGTTLIGIAFACVSTVPGTYVLTNLFTNRSTILGAYFTLGALGGVAGPQLYHLNDLLTQNWRTYWIGFAMLAVLAGIFSWWVAPRRREEKVHEAAPPELASAPEMIDGLKDWTVRRALATPQYFVIVGGYTSFLLVNTTTHGFGVQHLIERGVSAVDAGLMMSIEALVAALVAFVGGVMGEKIQPKMLMILSLFSVTLGSWGLAEATGWPLMWMYIIGVGIGFGLSFLSATMLLLDYFGKKPNLELFSIMCMISTIAAIGPLIGGWVRDVTGNFHGLLLAHALISAFLMLGAVLLRPPAKAAAAASGLQDAAT